jgi:SAM-dependent methyltransferase
MSDQATSAGNRLGELYRPAHDEAARQRFVGVLKGFANGPLEGRLAAHYERTLRPQFARTTGREAPVDRAEGRGLLESDALFQLWGSMVYASQGLMWQSVGETCRRLGPAFEARAQELTRAPRGSLTLNPALELPQPIAETEIHRQPGGYFHEASAQDLHAALQYFGTLELYRAAKGLTAHAPVGEPGIGRFIAGVVKRRFPDLAPRRILDLGCGPGTETIAYQEAFPQAEVHGLDLSAPFVRFGHAWAEGRGMALHFRQADARATGYPEGHFDLIVSHILFHETWHDIAPRIFAEAHRLLAPGGVLLNADVPYQPARISIPKQVTNDWQVRNNGEPFWTGFADTDVPSLLRAAGFAADAVIADYEPLGAGHYYFFGGRKGLSRHGTEVRS